jgi:copper transport protein
LLIAAGGALFVLVIARFPGERTLLAAAAVVAIAAALACIPLHGADLLDTGLLQGWHAGLFSSLGLSSCVAAAGALLIAIAARLTSGPGRTSLLAVGALAAIGSLPLTGHAITAHPAAAAMVALATHGLAAAFWVGSLVALLATVSLRSSSGAASAAPVLRRFSVWGMVAVAALLVAGVAFVLLQLDSVAALFGSRYGWLILCKVVLLLGLVLLALANRFRWLPMLERGAAGAAARLRRSIGAEVALVVCVIGVTAVLVHTPPPRSAVAAGGFTQKLAYKSDFAEVAVTPARAGANAIVVRFQDREGLPFDPEEVLVEVGNPAAGVEPAARAIRRVGPGDYRRDGRELAFPGLWTIEVQARIDNDIAVFRTQVPVR